ncbi:hypothetical protein TSUD_56340 [Trifolium subterraneum]|uniref:Uncharacterized protein n=1 Tax=Trifolium subterraneum TaxID=3900 RepID=A0A2Z6MTL6_TRISU|nr:hypothetical protein TSUD_56340 [Trifolium subterraneum]
MAIELEEDECSRRKEKVDDQVKHRQERVDDKDGASVQNIRSASQTPDSKASLGNHFEVPEVNSTSVKQDTKVDGASVQNIRSASQTPDSKASLGNHFEVPEVNSTSVKQDTKVVKPNHASASGEKQGSGSRVPSRKRTKSCPPGVTRSVTSSPWSLEWMHDHNHGEAGIISPQIRR